MTRTPTEQDPGPAPQPPIDLTESVAGEEDPGAGIEVPLPPDPDNPKRPARPQDGCDRPG